MKFVFEKPYTFEGKEYSEVILDLDGMKAEDTEAAAEQAELMVGQNKARPLSLFALWQKLVSSPWNSLKDCRPENT